MGKNYVESSLKRFLKRKVKITMGLVVAFMIMGTGVFAEEIYYAKTDNITKKETGDITAKVNTSGLSEGTNRFTAIGAEAGKTLTLTTDGKINIVNGESITNPDRLYGIALNGESSADITASEINFNVSTTGNTQLRAVRNNKSVLSINSDLKGLLTSENAFLRALDCWDSGTTKINGNLDLSLTSKGGTISAIGAQDRGNIVIVGNSNINVNSETGRIVGVENWGNAGGKIEFNGDFNLNTTNGKNYNQFYQGVLAYQSTTNFNGNTNINMINNSDISTSDHFLVDVQCDPGNAHDTIVNFNGAQTTLSYESKGKSSNSIWGVSVSGVPGSVNFNGAETNISIITENSEIVTALESQYGGNINSAEESEININVVNKSEKSDSIASGIIATAYAEYNGNLTLNGTVDIITKTNAGTAYGILNETITDVKREDDGKVLIGGNLNISSASKTGKALGVSTTGKYGETTLNGDTVINVDGKDGAVGVSARNGGNANVTGKNISISATSTNGNATAVEANNGTGAGGETVKLGGENTENLILKAEGKNYATGIEVVNHDGGAKETGSKVEINSKNLVIDVHSKDSEAAGIWVQNSTTTESSDEKIASVVVNSENTVINVTSDTKGNALGLVTMSQGKLDINGNLEVNAETAILTRGNAVTNINQNNDKTVKLNGDIEFNYDKPTSGTPVDATLNLNLSNAESYFKGKIVVTGEEIPENYEKVSEMNLGLSNQAVWENTGDSLVSNLTLENGIINNTSAENDISVGNLKGNGGAINMAAEIGNDGKATSGALNINTINDNTKLNINYSGTDNLEVNKEKAEEVFGQLAEKITVENGNLNATAKLEEGFVSSEYVSELTKNENGNVVVKEDSVKVGNLNSMVEGMRDLATINLLTWRQEMNSLNKRMGELRNSTGEHGVWSRVYTGKIENGSKYDNDYQTYQVGYDKKYTVDNGVMFVGGLVSYTDGETDYALGHGENYSVGAGIYATWLNNDGQFADVVLKQSRLHNKFDVTSKNGKLSQSGDYNNWGTSLSGQYGRRFDLNDKFFIEPSVELTLGRVDDTNYATSAGVDVHQDTMYSLVGNVGTAVGYKFSDKGNIYARASLVKEFQGDVDTEYRKDGVFEKTSEDLSDTWGEFGAGVNYRFIENMNVYVDVQKTGEAQVDNKWQANLGFRYEF